MYDFIINNNKYRCEFVNLFCIYAEIGWTSRPVVESDILLINNKRDS